MGPAECEGVQCPEVSWRLGSRAPVCLSRGGGVLCQQQGTKEQSFDKIHRMNRSPWFLVSEPKTYCRHHSRAYRYEHSTLPHPGEEDTQAEEESSSFVYSVYPSPSSLRPRLGGSREKPGRVQGQRVQLAQSGRVSSWPQICPHPRRPRQLLPSQSTGKDDTGPQVRVGGRCRLQGGGGTAWNSHRQGSQRPHLGNKPIYLFVK